MYVAPSKNELMFMKQLETKKLGTLMYNFQTVVLESILSQISLHWTFSIMC